MTDYLETLSSQNQTGFYAVPEGSSLTTARALLAQDLDVAPDLVSALPDPGAGYEWYVDDGTATPTTPTGGDTIADGSDQSGETNPQFYTSNS